MQKKKMIRAAALALSASLLLGGCGISKNATVVKIAKGSDTISLGYANFYAKYTQSMYDQIYRSYYGDDYWHSDKNDPTMETSTKEDVIDSIKRDYILVSHAGDYNVELSKEDEDKIAEAVNAFLSSNTPQALNEMGATKDIVTEYLKNRTTCQFAYGKQHGDLYLFPENGK